MIVAALKKNHHKGAIINKDNTFNKKRDFLAANQHIIFFLGQQREIPTMADTETIDAVLKQANGPGDSNTRKRRLSKRERKNLKKKKVQVEARTPASIVNVADGDPNNSEL